MVILTFGIELAKSVFAVHGADTTGKVALVHTNVAWGKLLELFVSLPPCIIGRKHLGI